MKTELKKKEKTEKVYTFHFSHALLVRLPRTRYTPTVCCCWLLLLLSEKNLSLPTLYIHTYIGNITFECMYIEAFF